MVTIALSALCFCAEVAQRSMLISQRLKSARIVYSDCGIAIIVPRDISEFEEREPHRPALRPPGVWTLFSAPDH